MPVYEYRCKNCSHDFEVSQAMSDDPLTVCPQCGEPQLRKVFQPVGISFKGSGFYKNDSRSSSSATTSGGSGSSASTSAESSGTSSPSSGASTTSGSSGTASTSASAS